MLILFISSGGINKLKIINDIFGYTLSVVNVMYIHNKMSSNDNKNKY